MICSWPVVEFDLFAVIVIKRARFLFLDTETIDFGTTILKPNLYQVICIKELFISYTQL